MKKVVSAVLAAVLAIGLAGVAMAHWGQGGRDYRGYGPGSCWGPGYGYGPESTAFTLELKVDAEKAKETAEKFVAENLKGFKVTEVSPVPYGRRFPHYLARAEKDDQVMTLRIDAVTGTVVSCLGPGFRGTIR